tara:strand:- start:53 stop:871 length:819 start_codon:yes stop_codon:yes gene_type:complete
MTIRLPDFSKDPKWKRLRSKMGADKTYVMPEIPIPEISIKEFEKLQTGSISIENILDHINPKDNTFDYKGQKVLLYIKQQRYNMRHFSVPTYKFHIAYCTTLDWMESENRFKSRYVVTQRIDGKFEVDIINKATGQYHYENKLFPLDICKNCLSLLQTKYPEDSIFQYSIFNIDGFIKKYNTQHIKRPIHTPQTMPRDEYGVEWNKLSKEIRERENFICSGCKNDFSKNKGSLHVHHMDGVKWNHNIKNLRVLCIDCHRKEPGHSFRLKKAG